MAKIAVWKLDTGKEAPFEIEKVLLETPAASLNAASKQIPGGVYTTFRTYSGDKVLLLENHLLRLEESASLVNRPIDLDHQSIREALCQAIQQFPAGESRIRVTVDLEKHPGTVYITMEPLTVPSPEEYHHGVHVITYQLQRDIPRAKQTRFITIAESFRSNLPSDINEVLLYDESGRIREGSSSNFFAVKGGEIRTAGENVLYGITRSLVLQSANHLGIPVRFEPVSVEETGNLQEAFITSSSRSILPICQIDQTIIGSGKPGPITKALSRQYWQEIEARLEEI